MFTAVRPKCALGRTVVTMTKHTTPPTNPLDRGAPPTMAQDQAVVGWLATRPALPDLTRDLLLDALIFWVELAPLPVVTAMSSGGVDDGVGGLLRGIGRRLLAHPCHPDDLQTQMALIDIHRMLGLAWYSLHDPAGARAGRTRWEQHLDWVSQLRVLETDTAVELALADLRRERGE
jgi:hypothetical protein